MMDSVVNINTLQAQLDSINGVSYWATNVYDKSEDGSEDKQFAKNVLDLISPLRTILEDKF